MYEIFKGSISWDIMPSSPQSSNISEAMCHIHLQGWRVGQARNQHEAGSKVCGTLGAPALADPLSPDMLPLAASCWFLAWLTLQSCRWRWHVPPKHQLTFNRLHGNISQKTELTVTTATTSNYKYGDGAKLWGYININTIWTVVIRSAQKYNNM
jgi:hypothetical protein